MIKLVQIFVEEYKIENALVGFSGGVDSTVLLYILKKFTNVNVRAVYVDHNLSKNSKEWLKFCRSFCLKNNIDFISEQVNLNISNRESLENVARNARYNIYDKHIKNGEHLILGHHNDDQVETILLQLFRGTGLSGLSGMPLTKEYKSGFISRPFLYTNSEQLVTKCDINKFAKENNIEHIHDESNDSNNFRRNFLRNEIIPKIKSEFGNINKAIQRTSEICSFSESKIRQIVKLDFENVSLNNKLNIKKLVNYSDNEIIDILRYWMIDVNQQKAVSKKQMLEIIKFIKNYSNDNKFLFKWDNLEIKAKKYFLLID